MAVGFGFRSSVISYVWGFLLASAPSFSDCFLFCLTLFAFSVELVWCVFVCMEMFVCIVVVVVWYCFVFYFDF